MSEVSYTSIGGLSVHPVLQKVVKEEVCEGTEISTNQFWRTLEALIVKYGSQNEALLRKRDSIQAQIDAYHLSRAGKAFDAGEYTAFLANIGYIVPEGPDFEIDTDDVDPEIASIAGPQLVVPVDKARFALNAANSRWGSLLDAYYGTDAGPEETPGLEKGKSYNPKRGAEVFKYAHAFLDEFFEINGGKFDQIVEFKLCSSKKTLEMVSKPGTILKLKDASKFVGYNESNGTLSSILLKNNDLHVELQINKKGAVGSAHAAGINNVIIESAITAICDFEDSVAAVDALDKSIIYKNWSRLMKNTLEDKFQKGGKTVHRVLNKDKVFNIPGSNQKLKLPGRVVLLVRNVGLHMYTDAVLFGEQKAKKQIPEGFLDLVITAVSSLHDIGKNASRKDCFNSRTGSVYIVKPKQHGPEEVRFTCNCFDFVEKSLGLKPNSLKIGIMDEERRTTVNLKECIRMAKNRCIFINTGFMDRTGDEFHTSMRRGPFVTKQHVKLAPWLDAYEAWNVEVGIQCGLIGKAQIGKGMWAAPDSMKAMLEKKIVHPRSGANCAWVPSPTAATLHAIHYHKVDVKKVLQQKLSKGKTAKLGDILTPPLKELYKGNFTFNPETIQKELDNNSQAILGYVVRWVLLGIGCSKVPDISDEPLMEDRATLRINSQHIANWLLHGIVSESEVLDSLKRMAEVVDKQNSTQEGYKKMSGNFETNNGFLCALELVFNGLEVANGLTEWSLSKFRLKEKREQNSSRL